MKLVRAVSYMGYIGVLGYQVGCQAPGEEACRRTIVHSVQQKPVYCSSVQKKICLLEIVGMDAGHRQCALCDPRHKLKVLKKVGMDAAIVE